MGDFNQLITIHEKNFVINHVHSLTKCSLRTNEKHGVIARRHRDV